MENSERDQGSGNIKVPRFRSPKAQTVSSYSRSRESQPTADYPMLHETARHSIHSSETLEIAAECLLAMCQQHSLLANLNSSKDKRHELTYTKTHQGLQFRLQVLRSLKARSQANEARLRNEITLVRGKPSLFRIRRLLLSFTHPGIQYPRST